MHPVLPHPFVGTQAAPTNTPLSSTPSMQVHTMLLLFFPFAEADRFAKDDAGVTVHCNDCGDRLQTGENGVCQECLDGEDD